MEHVTRFYISGNNLHLACTMLERRRLSKYSRVSPVADVGQQEGNAHDGANALRYGNIES